MRGDLGDLFDFTDVVNKVLKSRAGPRYFAAWSHQYKPSLVSAVCGGQWPQARLASTRKFTSVSECQLCHAAVGTLAHRHECPATAPPEG